MVGRYGGRKLFEYGYLGGYSAIVQVVRRSVLRDGRLSSAVPDNR
jgi:hypothetical protein